MMTETERGAARNGKGGRTELPIVSETEETSAHKLWAQKLVLDDTALKFRRERSPF
jgi:hypothetical protein